MTTTIEAEQVQDLQRIRAFMSQDPFATAYMLGNLDASYQGYCTWYLATEGGRDIAVLQLYTGLSAPVIITHGTSSGITAILARFVPDLPARAHVHLMPEHLAVVDRHFELQGLRSMVRMALVASRLDKPGAASDDVPGYGPVERLGHRDTGEIMGLFGHYPDSFFEPHQLSTGHYYGIRALDTQGGHVLVAVAGVHVASRFERVAALGNIVTHPEHRGRGLSTRVTSHLCRALVHEGIEFLALNVERKNDAALKVYGKLGFQEHCTYLEGFVTRTLGKVASSQAQAAPIEIGEGGKGGEMGEPDQGQA